jgi:hypothetical protein
MNDVSPRELLERILRLWWVIAAGMLLGGMAAWVFSRFRPPVYEAIAIYEVSLDQQQLADRLKLDPSQLPMDFTAQNVYLAPAENIFYIPEVVARLVADANAQGIKLKDSDFYTPNFSMDRKGGRWLVSVRNSDPVIAAQLVNLWVASANSAIQDAQTHYARFMALQDQRTAVQKCFSKADFPQANQCAGTSFGAPAELDAYLNSLEQQIISEQQAGRDIDPALRYSFVGPADPPSFPVLYNTSTLILAGAVIGLLVAGLVLQRLPVHK